jgi:hypothetical protein
MTPLILKRAPNRRQPGRLRRSGERRHRRPHLHGADRAGIRRAAHAYEKTREAAMAACAKATSFGWVSLAVIGCPWHHKTQPAAHSRPSIGVLAAD